jgi:hypothetical protein
LADKAGISRSYANEIVKGRKPNRALAVHIFTTTGWKPSVIADMSDDDCAVFARIQPWAPRSDTQAAA